MNDSEPRTAAVDQRIVADCLAGEPGAWDAFVSRFGGLFGYVVDRTPVGFTSLKALSAELQRAAAGNEDPVVVINADAKAAHQAVIRVLNAAQLAGYGRITFAAQNEIGRAHV